MARKDEIEEELDAFYIHGIIEDLIVDFLYYNTKNNEERYDGDIADAVENGVVTIEDMVAWFEQELRTNL